MGTGNEARWGLGMRLGVAWEQGWVGTENEARWGLGMRLGVAWE